MLQNLSIQDFLLIEKLDLDFHAGFCVITGQTGAGKSILLTAIRFAFGAGGGAELVRTGKDKAVVTLVFALDEKYLSQLPDFGIDLKAEDSLVIRAVQFVNGRKKFFINDQIVSQKSVNSLFDYLLEIHGQHSHTALLNSANHLEILDQFAGNSSLRQELYELYKKWQDSARELEKIERAKGSIESEIDYLTHVCQEFEDLKLIEGEEERLQDIKRQLQNSDNEIKLITTIIKEVEAANIEQLVVRAQRQLAKRENEQYNPINQLFEDIYNKTEELKHSLNEVLQRFAVPEYPLEEIDDRLYSIRSIARKHGCTVSELASFIETSKQKLIELQTKMFNSSELASKIESLKKQYFAKAKLLSETRNQAARNLEKITRQELELLDMKKAVFIVDITSTAEELGANSKGIDRVRFLASTNPGLPKAPIDKIASGGELSRLMLAFRAALFDKYPRRTIVFDEIDVGISGSVADSIGQRLKNLGQAAQVIVITHQPQVAGKADQHILVTKQQYQEQTSVSVNKLDLDQRILEVARMISGQNITDKSLAAAKELID